MENPLHHFELHPWVHLSLFGLDLSINKAVVIMWIAVALLFGLFMLVIKSGLKIVPGKSQSVLEVVLSFLRGMTTDMIGEKGDKFFPYIATLFLFLLTCNLLGLVPTSYTVTSQLVVTGAFAIAVFIISLIVGFVTHKAHFFSILVPSGVPAFLIPVMILLEILSMMVRPITLSLRLFANMTAGHVLLGIFFGLTLMAPAYIGWIPFGATVVFNAFEIFVALIQAYIFTLLTCVYLGEAVNLH